ncbi:hypothetical protein C8034_v011200 [Colletotrichum sidae]|uniref:Uncharacterized protein n=1 Tax=Colletotrichum sidae TaxID=1347389 RepID=A0A4R8TK40_9PEZI|nr:hypothetical protein C8034_v011200 [Colletotrichum sidae]
MALRLQSSSTISTTLQVAPTSSTLLLWTTTTLIVLLLPSPRTSSLAVMTTLPKPLSSTRKVVLLVTAVLWSSSQLLSMALSASTLPRKWKILPSFSMLEAALSVPSFILSGMVLQLLPLVLRMFVPRLRQLLSLRAATRFTSSTMAHSARPGSMADLRLWWVGGFLMSLSGFMISEVHSRTGLDLEKN